LPGETEENNKTLQSVYAEIQSTFKPGTSKIQNQICSHYTKLLSKIKKISQERKKSESEFEPKTY
jgi:hypothetical protein